MSMIYRISSLVTLLSLFIMGPSDERMTVDGKFYTSGGVTSGIDMALRVVADIAGETTARKIQLAIEYDPAPCVYRKPKPGRSGDEVRQGWGVNL
jgi:hypothetical protein